MNYKKDYIKIDNLKQFLIKEIKQYHPSDPRHTPYWAKITKYCIEGLWGQEFGEYRYMPGRLFFYGNFCTIVDVDEEQNTRQTFRPYIRDIEWERAYMVLEAEGFSGWTNDDDYTSDYLYFKVQEEGLPDLTKLDLSIRDDRVRHRRYMSMINKNGELKKFISPRENIRKLHKKPQGIPLYYNGCKNIIELGARGGGKSYFYALAVVKYEICFDGVKKYNAENILNPPKAETCVGSGQKNKSAEFCNKIEDSMKELATLDLVGAWGKLGDEDYEPSPLHKEMAGTIGANNKENLWRHSYKVLEGGREVKEGTGSYVAHVIYSTQRRDGAEAAAGGRYSKLIYEEIGLLELLTKAWGSNNSTVTVGSKQFGVQIGLGTSGNMETIQAAKEIFTHPKQYNCIAFNDDWEQTGEICFFLPAYMTNRDFKDANGNTDIDAAVKYYKAKADIAAQADNPHVLAIFKMNNPIVPSDMWQTNKSHIMPVNEAEAREKVLMRNHLYERVGTPVKFTWDSNYTNGVKYEVDHDAHPFYEPKYRYQRDDLAGAIQIYEFPQEINGVVPNDMYRFVGHDPYVSDNIDEGDSLGAAYIIMNPKYIPEGYNGNTIVAGYVGKPNGGRKEYYQNLEKLLAFYGNPPRGLWFEANKGDFCRGYFIKQNKPHLMCIRPTKEKGSSIYEQRITQYGYIVGNKVSKVELLDKVAEWLLEETELNGEKKRNIERIPCIFLIRQIAQFSLEEGNYDAVMALVGAVLGIREAEHELVNEYRKKAERRNKLASLSMNTKIFNANDTERRMKAFEEKYKLNDDRKEIYETYLNNQ